MQKELSEKEEAALLEKWQNPESRRWAFRQLIEAYQQPVYHLIRRMVLSHEDADDLTQETFVKVWEKLEQFEGRSRLYTWIYRMATNEALGFLRKKRRRALLRLEDVSGQLKAQLHESLPVEAEEIVKKLQEALLQLPDKQRLVFQLKYYEELKYEEMASITGNSVGALKANYHHACQKIEKWMKGNLL